MQSWWMQTTGTTTALELRDVPVPEPGPTQLLVRMHAAALNRGEFVPGHGLHGKAGTWKAIGGEGAGEPPALHTPEEVGEPEVVRTDEVEEEKVHRRDAESAETSPASPRPSPP